jgi:hypothetical protein
MVNMSRIVLNRNVSIGFSRRQLLRRAALVAASGAALHAVASPGVFAEPAEEANPPAPPPGAIDAHVHVWTPDV